jgi:C-terminal processing protease CtpA/Prc
MKKFYTTLVLMISLLFIIQSCGEDFDDVINYRSTKDFVWKGLNEYYLWQNESPDLVDTRFISTEGYKTFLDQFNSPEALFSHLLVNSKDRFSVIFSDYEVLENALQGTSKNNGAELEFRRISSGSPELFAFVRYILPNSDASTKSIQRGNIIYAINGVSLTIDNYRQLQANDTFTLNFADFINGTITPNGNSVSLTKTPYAENPVLIRNTHQVGTKKVGYLMYNGFFANFKEELNNAFAYFQAESITHLVVDLRYNSGGSVQVATELGSMITGQFNGQVFGKQQWNSKLQAYFNSTNAESLINRFANTLSTGSAINSLGLNQVYILTSPATASASELVINSLKPYINVVQIGTSTVGKNVGSVTLYDSTNFRKQNVNPNHRYAMQPIVLKIVNASGLGEFQNGLLPNVSFSENTSNLGVLGENTEPLLSIALNYINTNGRFANTNSTPTFEYVNDSKNLDGIEKGMYLENFPNNY